MARIKEIFESIQGEGAFIGEKQIFVRFAGCNLNCAYCDTNHMNGAHELNEKELFDEINKYNANTISFTGGEPLLHSKFLKSFFEQYYEKMDMNICLETNGTLYENLSDIIDYIDDVSMDIKIKSATKEENDFIKNEEFLKICHEISYIKVVFTPDITDDEIENICYLAKKYEQSIYLQPKTPIDIKTPFMEIYNKFYEKHDDVYLIPQIHPILRLQ